MQQLQKDIRIVCKYYTFIVYKEYIKVYKSDTRTIYKITNIIQEPYTSMYIKGALAKRYKYI